MDKNILGTETIPRLMLKLGIPALLAQLIALLYNIVDRIYIGHIPEIGPTALTGVGVTFPLIIIINAFAVFVGAGGAPLMSIALGAKNEKLAGQILNNSFKLLLIFSALLFFTFLFFKLPLLYAFGATDNVMRYSNTYISICIWGIFFVQIYLGLNPFISAQGYAKTAMLSVLVGAIVNIILDPILIFGFNMGVKGAAIATISSQAISAAWVFRFLKSKRSQVTIERSKYKLDGSIIYKILALGSSPFVMQLTESAIIIVFNRNLREYGGYIHLGAMTIMQSIMQMIFIPVNGFRTGVQPIMSYNYGARKYDRVKKAAFLNIGSCFLYASLFSIFCILTPKTFAQIFANEKNSAEMIEVVGKYLPIFVSGMLVFGIQMGTQAYFVALGEAGKSLFLALLRKVFLLIPLAFILPRFIGITGVYCAEPISDTISGLTSGVLFLITYKKILSLNK